MFHTNTYDGKIIELVEMQAGLTPFCVANDR